VYERLYVSLVSASYPFLEWIQTTVRRLVGITGVIHEYRRPERRSIWDLRYAKAASIRLIRWMHYDATVPCLDRKRARAARFLTTLGSQAAGAGRATEGRMAVQYRRAGFGTEGVSGPGWRNGRLAALKTPCPQGRAGSNPAPGTNFTTPFLTRPAAGR
jgi:hypothetical protein